MRKNLWRDYGADPKDQPDFTSHDVRFADKTLMQKKIMIVEREINLQGMGRYQVSRLSLNCFTTVHRKTGLAWQKTQSEGLW